MNNPIIETDLGQILSEIRQELKTISDRLNKLEVGQGRIEEKLMDVCARRHHQIILSTHSSVILKALPSEARKLLIRDENGVEINNEISTTHAKSILSGGNTRELNICVEDKFA